MSVGGLNFWVGEVLIAALAVALLSRFGYRKLVLLTLLTIGFVGGAYLLAGRPGASGEARAKAEAAADWRRMLAK